MSGTLPAFLGDQLSLFSLLVDNNNFSGPVPDSYSKLAYLLEFKAHNNSLLRDNSSERDLTPDFLILDDNNFESVLAQEALSCPLVLPNTTTLPLLTTVTLDPEYWSFAGCVCSGGYTFTYDEVANNATCVPLGPATHLTSTVLVAVVPCLIVVLVGISVLLYRSRKRLSGYARNWAKTNKPPGAGQMATLVATDVEGSTMLWEWNHAVMDEAIEVHDRIMRAQLFKFGGYEITTEGDAFLMAFHEPTAAVAWGLATQQALLTAKWPTALQYHEKSCIRCMDIQADHPDGLPPTSSPSRTGTAHHLDKVVPGAFQRQESVHISLGSRVYPQPQETLVDIPSEQPVREPQEPKGFQELTDVHPHALLFRGLAVRMAMSTGQVQSTSINPNNNRVELEGDLVRVLHALQDAPSGGQLITDGATFAGINSSLDEVMQRVPRHPDYEAIRTQQSTLRSLYRGAIRQSMSDIKRMDLAASESSGSPLAPFTSDSRVDSVASSQVPWELVPQPSLAVPLPPRRRWWQLWAKREVDKDEAATTGSLVVMDMGTHVFKDLPEPKQLYQVLAPGLEERARVVPPLSTSEQLSPGYLDAPSAAMAPLSPLVKLIDPLPDVTIVFCSLEALKVIKALDEAVLQKILVLYRDVVRRVLQHTAGYEAQESEGTFMLAFPRPMKAIQFCLLVQEAMVDVHWGEDVTSKGPCKTQVGPTGQLVFLGPRVKMGIYQGTPDRVTPHTTAGRADYFGTFVNRAARHCNGAAHGGQVCCPLDIMTSAVEEWTGCECPALPTDGEPRVWQAVVQEAGAWEHALSSLLTSLAPQNHSLLRSDLVSTSIGTNTLHTKLNGLSEGKQAPLLPAEPVREVVRSLSSRRQTAEPSPLGMAVTVAAAINK
eukprot:jgi/Astpho2/5056/fgenesh1_pg.00071_%23_35_t